jgi:ribonuclease BN (tRNA processing enzyme)
MVNVTRPQDKPAGMEPSRRGLLKSAVGFAGIGATLGLAPSAVTKAFAQNAPAANQDPATTSVIRPTPQPMTGTHLVMLGTRGGPGIDLRRAMTASVVLVDGTPYLIDCGYGTMRNLVACGLGYMRISNVFFTHLHNDHTLDLPALLSMQWTGNRVQKTDVYGPYATAAMVESAKAFFAADVAIRDVDEGRTIDPDKQFKGHDLQATEKPAQAYKDDKVTITSIENAHFPPRSTSRMPYRSLAYRFDTKGRSIAFSGDSAYTKNLVDLAQGADVYVSEVMDQAIYDQMMARAKVEMAKGNPDNIWRHVATTHSTPADVGRTAREAKVKTVVLNHLLPGTTNEGRLNFPISTFVDGVRKEFDGEVIVADDLMVI